MKALVIFSYFSISTVIRPTESILIKVGPPPLEKFSGIAPVVHVSVTLFLYLYGRNYHGRKVLLWLSGLQCFPLNIQPQLLLNIASTLQGMI